MSPAVLNRLNWPRRAHIESVANRDVVFARNTKSNHVQLYRSQKSGKSGLKTLRL